MSDRREELGLTIPEALARCVREQLKLRDTDGCIYWVDSSDETGAYIHSDDGDTHRVSHEQIDADFVFIDADA